MRVQRLFGTDVAPLGADMLLPTKLWDRGPDRAERLVLPQTAA